jgi:hypothetical protein
VPYDGPFDLPDGSAVTVPLTGCAGPGYAATFEVGSQTFALTVDTGSGTLAVASASCAGCGVSPTYSPGPSGMDQQKQTSDTYVLGSWNGEVYSDSVQLVGLDASVSMDFGAIDSQAGFFSDAGCAFGTIPFAPQGIVGFGPMGLASPGTTAFWSQLTGPGLVPSVFAIELCSSGGQLMVGGVDPTAGALMGPAQYTPMVSSSYYGVSLTDVQLSGVSLGYGAADFGTAVLDTGASVLALPTNAFTALASNIEAQPAFAAAFDGMTGWLGTTTCLSSSLSRAQLDAQLPTVTLIFPGMGGATIALTLNATDSYLPPTTASGTDYYCSGIYASPSAAGSSTTILGASALRGHVVIFDVADQKIGFAPQAFCR